MTCEQARQRLDGYVDGEPAAEGLEAHLRGCAACRAELEALRALRGRLQALPAEVSPPPEVWAGIASRIAAQAEAEGLVQAPFAARARALAALPAVRWALAAAAVLAIAVVGSLRPGPSPAPRQPVAAERHSARPGAELAALERECSAAQAVLATGPASATAPGVATLMAAVRDVDAAIDQTRMSLSDEDGAGLVRLADLWSTKLRLLRSAARLES